MSLLTKVAEFDGFELYHTSASTPEWANLKLVKLDRNGPKHAWWLAWNGERLARNKDAGLLEQHNPEIADKVREAAQANILTRRPQ